MFVVGVLLGPTLSHVEFATSGRGCIEEFVGSLFPWFVGEVGELA